VQILVALWMGIWTVVYARIPAFLYFKLLSIPAGFWLSSLPALAINGVTSTDWAVAQTDAWQGINLGGYHIYLSRHGIEQARGLLARALASTCCLYFVMLTVPFIEILQILRRLGCPHCLPIYCC
jgi:cobalt/nickel transport system permease protein